MSDNTTIEWTATVHADGTVTPGATWNPIRANRNALTDPDGTHRAAQDILGVNGWHCERVSPGCQHCYAETINEKRFGTGLPYNRKSRDLVEVYLDEKTLTQPLHWRRPRKIFVCSMTDLFGEWVPDEMIDRVFAVMALSPQHTFQVLTKRPERMRAYMSDDRREEWVSDRIWADPWPIRMLPEVSVAAGRDRVYGGWPLPNVWLGTSVEDQERADQRIPELLATPAAVRFVSYEPALGPVDFTRLDYGVQQTHGYGPQHIVQNCLSGWEVQSHPNTGRIRASRSGRGRIDWIIVGGESGPGARPFDIEWARSVVRQCQAAGVAVFYKQGGYHNRCSHDRKGGDPREWPEDLRVREFPEDSHDDRR